MDQAEHDAEARFPWGTLLLLLRCWVVVMALSLLKGGHGAPSVVGAACGAPTAAPSLGFVPRHMCRGLTSSTYYLLLLAPLTFATCHVRVVLATDH